jgi:CDP-diacylglycerol---glycerol-3-phosphate 3-phosphatidyltransferase
LLQQKKSCPPAQPDRTCMSIYELKPAFQNLLRPLVRALHAAGCTANTVTLAACALSVVLGCLLCVHSEVRWLFLLLPAFLFVRMALNAIDGMLAREFRQKSDLGAFLNELTDVISDAALYLPFAYLPHFGWLWVAVVIFLSGLSEMAGVVAVMIGAARGYDGPMGKSDRAFVFGALGLALGLGLPPAHWEIFIFPAIAVLLVVTIVNRVRRALKSVGNREVMR